MNKASIVNGRGVKITRWGNGSSVKGSWSSSRGGTRYTFTPEGNLTEGEQYKITLSTQVKNEAGTPLAKTKIVKFTVGTKTVESETGP